MIICFTPTVYLLINEYTKYKQKLTKFVTCKSRKNIKFFENYIILLYFEIEIFLLYCIVLFSLLSVFPSFSSLCLKIFRKEKYG